WPGIRINTSLTLTKDCRFPYNCGDRCASFLPASPTRLGLLIGGYHRMRASRAEPSADRMSSTVTWFAWGLAGSFFLFVMPIAFSSPYPTPSPVDWSTQQPPAQMALASASGFTLASASSAPVRSEEQYVPLVNTVKTLSIRRPIGDAPEPEERAERPIVTAS